MHPQTTRSPEHATGPPGGREAAQASGPDMETQLALARACDLLNQALCVRDIAYGHLAENPEDVTEAQNAVHIAQNTEREIRQIARQGRQDGARNANALLNTTQVAVGQARAEVQEHEGETGGEAVRRTAHLAEKESKERAAAAKKTTPSRTRRRRERHRPVLEADDDEPIRPRARTRTHAPQAGDNDANADDPLARAAARADAARDGPARTRDDDDAPEAHRTVRPGIARRAAQVDTVVRRSTYDAARVVGLLDAQGAQTAQRLQTGIVQARTAEERQYYERETGDAVQRRLLGYTFLDQEIRNALPQLERTGIGQQLINSDNTWTSDLYVSSVVQRLQRNGFIDGSRSMNPLAHSTNSQWSHAAVQRIDRNGDGQLSAGELEHAMTHRYQARAPAPGSRTGISVVTQGLDAARDIMVAQTAFGRQVQGMLAGLQPHTQQLDKDRDGRVELWEAVEQLRAHGITAIRDANSDGRINAADVPVMWNALRAQRERRQ